MAKRNMAETPEQVEEAAKVEAANRSITRRFKIASYLMAPARWYLKALCNLTSLGFDLYLADKDGPSAVMQIEDAYKGRMDNLICAFHNLLLAHERNEAGELVLPEKEMEGATRYIMLVTATSLSENGKAQLVALMERREARRAAAAKDSSTNNESGE